MTNLEYPLKSSLRHGRTGERGVGGTWGRTTARQLSHFPSVRLSVLFFLFCAVPIHFVSTWQERNWSQMCDPRGPLFLHCAGNFFPSKDVVICFHWWTTSQCSEKKGKRENGSKVFSTGVSHSMGLRLTYTLKLEIPAQTQICFQHMSRHGSLSVWVCMCVCVHFFFSKGVVPEG